MKIKLYKHSDDFLEDNRAFIYKNSLQANLIFGNAHASQDKAAGFYGAAVTSKSDTLLSIQIKSFPRVHYSNSSAPQQLTDMLADSYVQTNQIPTEINGDKKTVNALVNSLQRHSIKYTLLFDLLQRKCQTLSNAAVNQLKIVNANTLDYDFTDFYVSFAKECNLTYDAEKAKSQAAAMAASGNLYVLIDNDIIVTVAASNRKTQHGRVINFVYTPPQHRGKGYAASCVKQLTEIILKDNKYAFLYSDRNNPIANHVYQKLGYEIFGEFCQYKRILT